MAKEIPAPPPTPPIYGGEENRDLGFGSVISGQRIRLLNRDGTFNVKREGMYFWQSLSVYHWLLPMQWWKFGVLVATFYGNSDLFFARLYFWVEGPSAFHCTHHCR